MPTRPIKGNGKKERKISVFRLYLHHLLIFASYCQLMKDIYAELAGRVRSENKEAPDSERFQEHVNGKLVTPKKGTFLVQIIPENEGEKILSLLFRCCDLYLDSYHYDDAWYRFSDHEAELPSKDQLGYTRIEELPFSSRYPDLGGSNVDVGRQAFIRCYFELRKTNVHLLSAQGVKVLKSGPLAIPAVGISEAVRFPFQQKLVKRALLSGVEIHVTSKISAYFNVWGCFSTAMYNKVVPENCCLTLVQISNKLWVIRRQDLDEEKEIKNEAEKPLASLLAWHEEDKKRLLHAVCNVGDIDDTVKFYTKSFGMKLLREAPDEKKRSTYLGYGSEETNFALKLEYNHGVSKYDIGEGFGHLAIACENVNKLEKRIMSNGGEITRELGVVKGRSAEAIFANDRNGYKFELIERSPAPEPLCKVMLRIGDLDRSIKFYQKYTIARLGYADEDKTTVLELTYSYGISEYDHGNAYSQVVIATDSVHKSAEAVERMVKLLGGKVLQQPGSAPGSRITSFLDPDKWKVVLVDQADLIEEL